MCLTIACADPSSPGVWWRDDADWKQYDAAQAAAIRRAVAAGAAKVDLGSVVNSKYAGGARYVVDMATMKQVNLASGFARDVKIIDKPATPQIAAVDDTESVELLKELVKCKTEILSLKNSVLKLEVDVLAMKLQLAKKNAKRVEAVHAAIAPKSRSTPGPFSSNLSQHPMCEGAEISGMLEDYFAHECLSDDESEDDLLYSGNNHYYDDSSEDDLQGSYLDSY